MIKKITIIFFVTLSYIFAGSLIHPLDFTGTDKEKSSLIIFIEKNVEKTYCAIGMCQPSILRMMEKEELNSFKELAVVENRPLLDSVISTYCDIGMCNYSTILMMYKEESSASNKTLKW